MRVIKVALPVAAIRGTRDRENPRWNKHLPTAYAPVSNSMLNFLKIAKRSLLGYTNEKKVDMRGYTGL